MPRPESQARERYTHGHHESVLRSHRWRTAANSAAYLLPLLGPGQRLLDVGCGPGTITADFAELLAPDGCVLALDRAAGVLEACRSTLAERGAGNAAVAAGDAYALPFASSCFAIVHAHQVLQHLADPVAALRELGRVCRPDGIVAVRDADYEAMAWYPPNAGLDRWLALYLELARSNGGEPAAGRRLLAWARAAGFGKVDPSAGLWCYATPSERGWWGSLWAERITRSAFAEQAIAEGRSTRAELEALAVAWHDWASDGDAWFVVPNGEVLCRP